MKNTSRFWLLVLAVGFAGLLSADIPKMIHYQGFITDTSNRPYTGTGHFKFALVNQPGTTTYWNFDGSATAAGAEPPGTAVRLGVLKGLFSVLLGDTSVLNMNLQIEPAIFADHSQVYLRLWFSETLGGPYSLVTPDTRILAVGYAMVAQTLADGAITGPELAPSVTLGGAAGKGELNLKSAAELTRVVLDAGPSTGGGSLVLVETDGVTESAKLVAHESGKGGGQLALRNGLGQLTVEIDGQDGTSTSAGALVNLRKGDGSKTVSAKADIGDGNGGILLFTANGNVETIRITGSHDGTEGAFVGLKNKSGSATIQFDAQDGTQSTAGGSLRMRRNDEKTMVELKSDLGDGSGAILLFDGNGSERVRLTGSQDGVEGALLSLKNKNGDATIPLESQDGNDTSAPAEFRMKKPDGTVTAKLSNKDADGAGGIELMRAGGERTLRLSGDLEGNGKGGLLLFSSNGTTEKVRIVGSRFGTGGGYAEFTDKNGNVTVQINGDNNGEGRITAQVLEITGGADLSENFDISSKLSEPEAGMIVCIDPQRSGELRVSDEPYDRSVAGVVSGAGGVRPGMLMGQQGTRADGRHPVALSGRVYCRVDADFGAIKPGDLITTSKTPGHGMKADPTRAPGAVVGKAMTSLAGGRGLVLVLVSLQ